MAVLTATGIIFGDSTVINSKYGIMPQSTGVIFYQASAPTGWFTPATQYNDYALRITSGTGTLTGGVSPFSVFLNTRPFSGSTGITFSGLSVVGTTLNVNTIPTHAHPANSGGNVAGSGGSPSAGFVTRVAPGSSTGNYGNSGAHGHPISASATGVVNLSADFRVQYVDVIYCQFS